MSGREADWRERERVDLGGYCSENGRVVLNELCRISIEIRPKVSRSQSRTQSQSRTLTQSQTQLALAVQLPR